MDWFQRFSLIKSSSKVSGYKVNFEYPKKLRELHNNYPLAPGKIEIKKEMLFKYQLMIVGVYKIPIGNVKNWFITFFDIEEYVFRYENLKLYFKTGIKTKKSHRVLESNQSCWLKPYNEFYL